MSQHACANPLCEHFNWAVGNNTEWFALRPKDVLPFAPSKQGSISPEDVVVIDRIGRIVHFWIVVETEEDSPTPRCCSNVEWLYSHEKASHYKRETYYFCTDCDEVLKGAK